MTAAVTTVVTQTPQPREHVDPAHDAAAAGVHGVPVAPTVPGVLFHASPATFASGTRLVPGDRVGARTVGDGQSVHLAGSLEEATSWATYLGRRVDADAVFVYAVWVDELTGLRLDRRNVIGQPEFRATEARVEKVVATIDPWAEAAPGTRESLRICPF